MKIKLTALSEDNLRQCFALRVAGDQEQYISSNEDSWKTAKANKKVARPFAIYCDGKMVGFTMFAFDEDYEDPDDRYWLWRFMIDESFQGKGCGKSSGALKTTAPTISVYRPKDPMRKRCRCIAGPGFVIRAK